MDKIFKYYLKKDDSTYYYVVNGSVLTTSEPIEQIHYPEEWQNTEVSFKRDMRYWGIFPQYGETIDFVLDSAKILRYIRYNEGFEGACILYVEKLNTNTSHYEFFYQGALDFSTAQDGKDTFSINVLERGISEALVSLEDTTYEIPLNEPEVITLTIDGVKVGCKGSWYPGNYSSDASNGVYFSLIPWMPSFIQDVFRTVPLNNSSGVNQIAPFVRPHSQKGNFAGPYGAVISAPLIPGSPTIEDGEYLFFTNSEASEVTIDAYIQFAAHIPDVTGNKTIYIVATVVGAATIISQTILGQYSTSVQDAEIGVPIKLDGVFNMPANAYLVVSAYGIAPSLGDTTEEDAFWPIEHNYFDIRFKSKVAPSEAKGYHYIDLLKKVVNKMSDGESTVVSTYLSTASTGTTDRFNNWDTSPYWQILTCGNALRALPNSVIKTSLSDLYTDLWGNLMLALSIQDNNLKIEPLSTVLLNDFRVATIVKTNNMSLVDFKDKIFNTLKVGYGSYDNKNVVGKNEFNTGLEFVAEKVKRIKKEENEISQIRADVYGIESVRAETLGDDRLDNRSDNDTFKIEVDPIPVSGKYKVYRPAGLITGVDDPTNIYNVTLSPGRALRRHLSFYRSLVRKGKLLFQTTDKNPSLVSTFGAGTVTEIEDIDLEPDTFNGHDVSRLFLPYVFEFDCAPPFNLYNLALNNPYGYIEFDYYGTMMKGFILELSMIPAKGNCKCRLLSHPLNDESKLIR